MGGIGVKLFHLLSFGPSYSAAVHRRVMDMSIIQVAEFDSMSHYCASFLALDCRSHTSRTVIM